MSAEAFPLHWPDGVARTQYRKAARFICTLREARDELFENIRLIGGTYPVVSSDIPLRQDGIPYATAKEPSDPGIAVYFNYNGKQMVFACDCWDKTYHNMRAISKTIDAIRGISRWGASEMMNRAFSAFEQLPGPETKPARSCWTILDMDPTDDVELVKRKYRILAKSRHPDSGGDQEAWIELQEAFLGAKEIIERSEPKRNR